MATIKHITPVRETQTSTHAVLQVSRWVLGIGGAIAAFLGLLIMFGGEDAYVGIGGPASWRVGDIDQIWAWSLLAAGAVALVAGVMAFAAYRRVAGTSRAASDPRADLITHAVVFVLVNAFLWTQDVLLGDGVDYAWIITLPWAVGLVAHTIAYRNATHR